MHQIRLCKHKAAQKLFNSKIEQPVFTVIIHVTKTTGLEINLSRSSHKNTFQASIATQRVYKHQFFEDNSNIQ